MSGRNRTWTQEQLEKAVPESFSLAEVLRNLGLRPHGGNYATLKREISRLDLDTNHFLGQRSNCGNNHKGGPKKTDLNQILKKNRPFSSWHLKNRLLDENVFERKCYECDRTSWRDVAIPLELEHINGDHDDNRLENLTLLCPNCHALTGTYRNRKRIQIERE